MKRNNPAKKEYPIYTGKRRAMDPTDEDAPVFYYHVAPPSYEPGDDLVSAGELGAENESRAKWGTSDNYLLDDTKRISLHDNEREAKDYARAYGKNKNYLLRVRLQRRDIAAHGLRTGVNDEGYPYVEGRIPAQLIRVLRTPKHRNPSISPADAARIGVAAEYDAAMLYRKLGKASGGLAAKVFGEVADEERVHAGEFLRLLRESEPDEAALNERGAHEVERLIGRKRNPVWRRNPRYYHGTGSSFEKPDASKFDASGLFGPGYYMTSSPEVASSYAENRGQLAMQTDHLEKQAAQQATTIANLKAQLAQLPPDAGVITRSDLTSELKYVQDQLDFTKDQLAAFGNGGPQVRAINVPKNLKLLDADEPLPSTEINRIASVIDRYSPESARSFREMAHDPEAKRSIWNRLVTAVMESTGERNAPIDANLVLAEAGYDGIRYQGGNRIPMRDSAGKPIEHEALVIFPESLGRIENAFSGTKYGNPRRRPNPNTDWQAVAVVAAFGVGLWYLAKRQGG